ncbi:ABC transporter, putative, partial [Ixodes scapularis]
ACKCPGQSLMPATGIAIKDLSVTYNPGKPTERFAVSHLSLDFEEGHINTLLGQNGAGKTTTIKVLTGQCSPTSGDVFIYGRSITDQRAEFRKYLGYCPQYNTLYAKMTVKEHLIFFGNLKGLMSAEEVEEDVEKMLKQMNLAHMRDEQACRLSGGLQRRLCVAFSFIGGSKLVILDEPTSSVDPMARRNIWDLILKHKHDRTILLTTHHMDEADVLSDKVAIIHKGCLLCDGSPLVLKSKFGCGYQLSLTRSSSEPAADNDITDLQGILKVIRSVVPLAQVANDHGGGEVVISLPQRDPTENTVYPFSELISVLDERMLEFGFGTYGVSHVAEVGIAIVILMGLSFIPSRVVVYVVNERVRDEKQVQRISGIGPLLYWTTTFIWDMGLVLAAVILSCLIIVAFGLPVYVSKLNFPAVALLMVLFGWGATPLMYCLSRLFEEASISFVVLYCVNLFVGLNIAIIILVLNVVQFSFV